jgi:hypothetical protein
MAYDSPVTVARYPARHRADAVARGLRENKIGAAVVPSSERAGAWDVVVRPDDAERASVVVKRLQDD